MQLSQKNGKITLNQAKKLMFTEIWDLLKNAAMSLDGWMEHHQGATTLLTALFSVGVTIALDLRKHVMNLTKKIINKWKQNVDVSESPGAKTVAAGGDVDSIRSLNSPESTSQNTGGGHALSITGNTAPVTVAISADVGTGTPADALNNRNNSNIEQGTLQLTSDSVFLYNEMQSYCVNNSKPFDALTDYARAEHEGVNGSQRGSATLYIRVFTPMAELLEELHGSDYEVALALRREISKLDVWSLEKHNSEPLGTIISNIERILIKFFQATN